MRTAPFACSSSRRRRRRPPAASPAILYAGLDGLGADEILNTPGEFSSQLGLQHLVCPLRLRGMAAMLARIKHQMREQQG